MLDYCGARHASSKGNVASIGEPPQITQLLEKFSNLIPDAQPDETSHERHPTCP